MSSCDYTQFLRLLSGGNFISQCFGCSGHGSDRHWIQPPCKASIGHIRYKKNAKNIPSSHPGISSQKFGHKTKSSQFKGMKKTRPSKHTVYMPTTASSTTCNSSNPFTSATNVSSDELTSESEATTLLERKYSPHYYQMLKLVLSRDKKTHEHMKSTNLALKRKIIKLQRKFKNSPSLDMNIIEDLVEKYQDVLLKYTKLEAKNDSRKTQIDSSAIPDNLQENVQASTSQVQDLHLSEEFCEHASQSEENDIVEPEMCQKSTQTIYIPSDDQETSHSSYQEPNERETCKEKFLPQQEQSCASLHPVECQRIGGNVSFNQEVSTINIISRDEGEGRAWFGSNIPPNTHPSQSSERNRVSSKDACIQCLLLDPKTLMNTSEGSLQNIDTEIWGYYASKVNEIKTIYSNVLKEYRKQLDRLHSADEDHKQEWLHERKLLKDELKKNAKLLKEIECFKRSEENNTNVPHNSSVTAGNPLTLEHLEYLLEKWKSSDTEANLLVARQIIEDSIDKWLEIKQKTAAKDKKQLQAANDAFEARNKSLSDKLQLEELKAQDLCSTICDRDSQIAEWKTKYDHLLSQEQKVRAEYRQSTADHQAYVAGLQGTVEDLNEKLRSANQDIATLSKSDLEIKQQLKDSRLKIVELSEQIDQNNKENCCLNTQLEEHNTDLIKLTNSVQIRERDLKVLVAEYNGKIQNLESQLRKVSNLREDDGHQKEKKIRQLQMELEQMHVRNETFQRQLSAIASTYSIMFPVTDASDSSP